jgi:hypothetical protein
MAKLRTERPHTPPSQVTKDYSQAEPKPEDSPTFVKLVTAVLVELGADSILCAMCQEAGHDLQLASCGHLVCATCGLKSTGVCNVCTSAPDTTDQGPEITSLEDQKEKHHSTQDTTQEEQKDDATIDSLDPSSNYETQVLKQLARINAEVDLIINNPSPFMLPIQLAEEKVVPKAVIVKDDKGGKPFAKQAQNQVPSVLMKDLLARLTKAEDERMVGRYANVGHIEILRLRAAVKLNQFAVDVVAGTEKLELMIIQKWQKDEVFHRRLMVSTMLPIILTQSNCNSFARLLAW